MFIPSANTTTRCFPKQGCAAQLLANTEASGRAAGQPSLLCSPGPADCTREPNAQVKFQRRL